jgi:predicted DCC family thiol-disulfide oxidoreductase YuxK
LLALNPLDPVEKLATSAQAQNWLLYDGECPFCSAYVRMVRLQENAGPVRLVDARGDGPEYHEAMQAGFDLDEGMLLKLSGQYYHGQECIHALALLTRERDLFGRINGWVFRSQRRSALLYPVLRAGRNLALRLLGRQKLAAGTAGR